ncbi:MAG: DUF1460 domain-containing protein [Nitrospirae bacterium]|nr:DUF1460 domain-containing protein [Nitrospirota bacterium]
MRERIILGIWTEEQLDRLLNESSAIDDVGKRIEFLSAQFLGIEYKEATLIGDVNTPEVFVINIEGVDCFTFLDYIEAMRTSKTFAGFKDTLGKIRYRSGKISYEDRNHFFSDWREFNPDLVEDVTEKTGAGKSRHITKALNQQNDGTYYLPGIPIREREIVYIPSESVDDFIVGNLETGDYIGIYSEKQGLDVSHVGIIIKREAAAFFRHASSSTRNRKVVDEDFRKYISGKPGIVVLRAKG